MLDCLTHEEKWTAVWLKVTKFYFHNRRAEEVVIVETHASDKKAGVNTA